MPNKKDYVSTTNKVRTYLENLIKSLKEKDIEISQTDLIDIIGALNDIRKKTNSYIDKTKKALPLSSKNLSIEGNNYIAIFTEENIREIDPQIFIKECNNKKDFFKCIKVNVSEAQKILTYDRINKICINIPRNKIKFDKKK